MTPSVLMAVTGCTPANADKYAQPLTDAMEEFGIQSPIQQAAFLAQITHESARLSCVEENLNYSWQRLRAVWPRRFPTDAFARQYHRQPERIASLAYAGRLSNGPPSTGDGWRYRGRGFIQVTGRANYQPCGEGIGLDLLAQPDLLLDAAPAARSAAWFWKRIDGNRYVKARNIEGLSMAINGGRHGMAERIALTEHAARVLA